MDHFEKVIREKSDDELIEILRRSKDYQSKFIEMVITELTEVRKIECEKMTQNRNSFESMGSMYSFSADPFFGTIPTSSNMVKYENIDEGIKQIYAFAAKLLFEEKQTPQAVIDELIKDGIDKENAEIVVSNILPKNDSANMDKLWQILDIFTWM